MAVATGEVEAAKALYYQMAGWDEDGRPTRAKLEELALGWVADELGL
jgi:aldehyde:ferredoxin oxidoreductase